MTDVSPKRNDQCPCGSGKKFKYCCQELTGSGKSVDSTASQAANSSHALILIQLGKLSQAKKLLSELIRIEPNNAMHSYLLGWIAMQNGRHADAAASMRRAIAQGLVDPAAYYHFGCALAALAQYTEAATAFEQSLALKPDFLPARSNLANCLFEQRAFDQAERHYRFTLASDPGNLVACHNLAQIFYLTQRIEEAIEYFQLAAIAAPAVAELWASLATMQEADNRLDAAESSARAALVRDPHNLTASVALARVLRRRDQPASALGVLMAHKIQVNADKSAIAYWAEQGQVLELLGRYRESFDAYAKSKSLFAGLSLHRYDHSAVQRVLRSERSLITPDRLTAWSFRPQPATPIPLFIVGFPRSGTTLLEQMLGCHSLVVPCGELDTSIEREASRPGYPQDLVELDDLSRNGLLLKWRESYLEVSRSHVKQLPGVKYATDKMPLNLMRIGLIRVLFPEAKIVHVVRHPLDAVISAYFTPFQFGNDWSHRIMDTVQMFVDSWRQAQAMSILPGINYLQVRYEDLISDPESVLKHLLGALTLDWEPECLNFNQSKRIARTASYAQVNRAIYHTSKRRYRNFLDFIDKDALAVLMPVIADAGYEI